MTETFTASNGWFIDPEGDIRDADGTWRVVEAYEVGMLGRFFQEKRDAELGRWGRSHEVTGVATATLTHGAGSTHSERTISND